MYFTAFYRLLLTFHSLIDNCKKTEKYRTTDNQAQHSGLSAKFCGCLDKKNQLQEICRGLVGNEAMTAKVCEISFHTDHLMTALMFTPPKK